MKASSKVRVGRRGRRRIGKGAESPPPTRRHAAILNDSSNRACARSRWRSGFYYLAALATTGICTAIACPFYPHFDATNIAMLYLLGTTLGALRLGRGPAALMSVANVLALDYFFIPPRFSFDVQDVQYIFTLGVMLVVALVIANLVVTIQRHRELANARERRTATLYDMSRELAVASDVHAMTAAAVRHIGSVVHGSAVILLADESGCLSPIPFADDRGCDAPIPVRGPELQIAEAVFARQERRIENSIYLPLATSRRAEGVIVVRPQFSPRGLSTEELDLLDALTAQLALSLQRVHLVEAAEVARVAAERASLRNTLLASISHDLRTPLSAIAGAGRLIAQPDYLLNVDRRSTLGELIERKAHDMSRLLSNVLGLTQLESGNSALCTDWHAIEDLVAHGLRANEARLCQRRIAVDLPSDLPLILVEANLIVQLLGNLVENAAKYTPAGTTISITAGARERHMLLVVADDGPGLPPGDPERLFESFRRGRRRSNVAGNGLGLAICRAAARLHGGDIRAMNNPGGGARFEITLPVEMQSDVQFLVEPTAHMSPA